MSQKCYTSHNWYITLNNPKEIHLDILMHIAGTLSKYACIGVEEGSKCKTPHVHCLFMLDMIVNLRDWVEWFPGAEIKIAHDVQEVIYYCTKGGDFHEWGLRPERKHRKTGPP